VRQMNGMVRFVLQRALIANIARRTKRRGMKGEASLRCDVQQKKYNQFNNLCANIKLEYTTSSF
jgi:hypothetical protein